MLQLNIAIIEFRINIKRDITYVEFYVENIFRYFYFHFEFTLPLNHKTLCFCGLRVFLAFNKQNKKCKILIKIQQRNIFSIKYAN